MKKPMTMMMMMTMRAMVIYKNNMIKNFQGLKLCRVRELLKLFVLQMTDRLIEDVQYIIRRERNIFFSKTYAEINTIFAEEYNAAMKMYRQFDSEEKNNTGIGVTNNGFDWQRILQSTQRSRAINDTYLKHLQSDETLAEAYRILMDWNQK